MNDAVTNSPARPNGELSPRTAVHFSWSWRSQGGNGYSCLRPLDVLSKQRLGFVALKTMAFSSGYLKSRPAKSLATSLLMFWSELPARSALRNTSQSAIPLRCKNSIHVFRDDRWPVEGRLRLLIGHLQEKQIRELLDVVAIAEAVVAQNVAVVPEFLNDSVAGH